MTNEIPASLHVLLADDDVDDRFFFQKALSSFPLKTDLSTEDDGDQLLLYLSANAEKLPDIIFLDLNMPKVNGLECLIALQHNDLFRKIPVVVYSTWVDEANADKLYSHGAYYYVRKRGITELTKVFDFVFSRLTENNLIRPGRDKFILTL
jgi:CheY-like chemotaxis protein